jgi:hypothetical protein
MNNVQIGFLLSRVQRVIKPAIAGMRQHSST